MQLIIALETKNKEGSDHFYLRAIRQRFYFDRGTKITPVFMGGKGNYKNVKNKINSYTKAYSVNGGDSKVIYFVDVDSDLVSGDQNELNKEISAYCLSNDYELVWFKKDIEHVMLGERICNSLKTKAARSFFSQNRIYDVNESDLSTDESHLKDKQSNALLVFDKYLERRR